tara:strand:+ start:28359 stop:28925 length:567 start_codon:yes stop_codon:yes gene_type:complete
LKLIKINLNQTVSKAQLDQIKEEKKRWYIFGTLTSLFIIYLLWFSFMNYRMNNIIDSRQETISKIIKDTEELKKSGKINLSKIDIKTLNKFENKRMFWAPKLIALSEITPEDMAITGLDFENKKLQISAISKMNRGEKDFDVVQDFMKRIDENDEFNKDFKSIKFDSMEKSRAKGQEVLSFTIKAKLK